LRAAPVILALLGGCGGRPTDGSATAAGSGGRGSGGSSGTGGSSGGVGGGHVGEGGADAGSEPPVTDGGDAGDGGALVQGAMLFPAPNVHGVCSDPPLRITFSAPPSVGSAGKIQVFDASQPAMPVAALDMGAASTSDTIGGTTFNMLRPAYVDGNAAVLYLKSHALTYGKTYFVTVDAGAIIAPGAKPFSIMGSTTWTFSTAAAAPSNLSSLAVALDGSGDFCSVQGAIDALPAKNQSTVQILIHTGTYHEIIHFADKNNVTLLGQDRSTTVIEGTNNHNLNPSTSTRSLVGIDGSSGVVIDTLTIHNLTPQGGSQAEALRMEACDKCVVRNANIASLQDTLLWSGRLYAKNCTIAGNVDFIWGTGVAYFDACEIKTVVQAGANVQARNTASGYGYVFVDSKLTADPGITGQVLARIDVSAYPASHVAYINCQMGGHIAPAGWTITGGTPTYALRFWEYESVSPMNNPIDVSKRIAGSTQISAAQAMSMRDPTVVLSGWQPPP
jgi:pectin methylesterase-like acyl-CoA thioesterase